MMEPYNLEYDEKTPYLLNEMKLLSKYHIDNCFEYRTILNKNGGYKEANTLEEVPYLPVNLFKLLNLKSVSDNEVTKVLTSSGTTGQQVSRIYLDKDTSINQTKALISVMKPILQGKRLPMIILDTKSILKNRNAFSARGAGILGFSNFGRKHFYALNDDMSVDWKGIESFLDEHKNSKILLFGFTYIIWSHFYQEAINNNIGIDFGESVLIHGGGWKKMLDHAVDPTSFSTALKVQFGIQHVHNYYGMVEQVGSIFLECEQGNFHTPNFADVIIRDPITFMPLENGKQGLIQVISTLPKSYPGHSLLTEDLGTVYGVDNCSCGWKGKNFKVLGRIPKAELRGCSDTYAFDRKE